MSYLAASLGPSKFCLKRRQVTIAVTTLIYAFIPLQCWEQTMSPGAGCVSEHNTSLNIIICR